MATSLKHVKESMGEVMPESSLESNIGNMAAMPVAPPEVQYIVFKLVKHKQKRLTLDGIDHDATNPKTGQQETARLIRGAPSIWQSELVEFMKDKTYVDKNRIGLQFIDGICRIGMHDKNKLAYARAHSSNVGKRRNGSGKYDFYEYDAAEEQKMRHEVRMNRIKLIQTVSEMKDDKMIKLALFLGVRPYDEEVGLPRNADGYRTELLVLADTKTDIVSKYLNSQEVEVQYLVRKAIMDAKIDLAGQNGNAIWAGGGGFICKIPSHQKPIAYLTELAMTNSAEGRTFKQQLESLIT